MGGPNWIEKEREADCEKRIPLYEKIAQANGY